MIGERLVSAGMRHFGHVAGHTSGRRRRAYLSLRAGFTRMAGDAHRVIFRRLSHHFLVRIVARHATDPPVCSIETLAVGHPVWLEAHIQFSTPVVAHHSLPGPM